MYNWNTDTTQFRNDTDKKIWETVQLIEYGSNPHNPQKINKTFLIQHWLEIKNQINPSMRRLLEYVLWQKVSSHPINTSFWDQSAKLQKL